MKQYLQPTAILDFKEKSIQELIQSKGWNDLVEEQKIRSIYNYVRDDIKFGYNEADEISATKILEDGYGQCNTKATLFMALLRAVGIPNRIYGSTIDKTLQKGAITGIWFRLCPPNIVHSWVEVFHEGKWYSLEGLILDKAYLLALQKKFSDCKTTFCGYGVYTDNFENPQIEWNVNDTYIQEKGVNQEFGLFDTPDDFYKEHKQKIGVFKRWIFKHYVRFEMNKNVDRIRLNDLK
ncbi:MAG: transglutaminase-like domain-containing protein [Reichenbachiella sp.]